MTARLRTVTWIGLVVSVISVVLLSIAKGPAQYPTAFTAAIVFLAAGVTALAEAAEAWWLGNVKRKAQRSSHWTRKALRAIGVAVAVTALLTVTLLMPANSVDEEIRILANAPMALFSAFLVALVLELLGVEPRSEANS